MDEQEWKDYKQELADYEKECKKDFIREISEAYKEFNDSLDYYARKWTYTEPLGNEDIPIIIRRGKYQKSLLRIYKMILKNPFGMKDFFVFEEIDGKQIIY